MEDPANADFNLLSFWHVVQGGTIYFEFDGREPGFKLLMRYLDRYGGAQ